MSGEKSELQRKKTLGSDGRKGQHLDSKVSGSTNPSTKTCQIVHCNYGQCTACNFCLKEVLKHGVRGKRRNSEPFNGEYVHICTCYVMFSKTTLVFPANKNF